MTLEILVLTTVAMLAVLIYLNLRKKSDADINSLLDQKFDQKIPVISSSLRDQLKGDKEIIDRTAKKILDELKEESTRRNEAQKENISSFSEIRQVLKKHEEVAEKLSISTEGLKRVLSNNQLRGQFGEQIAEELLKMSGFVKGTHYQKNKSQNESRTRPDFTINLPEGLKINIDVKFPYGNLQSYSLTDNAEEKKEYMRLFKQDVKEKVKQCATRDYINPEDNTVDFVILFVPNEMVFSFIYENLQDIWNEAMKQKVIFAGPFSFTAILRLIYQSYDNFHFQKNVRKIITDIKVFSNEFQKYNEEFLRIGDRIKSLTDQYDKVDSTRTKQLMKVVEKIKSEENETPLLSDPVSEIGEVIEEN